MFGLLVLVGLFVAMTPGILFRLKGSKKVSAAAHAVLFGLMVYVVSKYVISYEGFQPVSKDSLQPCPRGSKYHTKLKECQGPMTCPDGYENQGDSCFLYVEPTCPNGAENEDGRCKTTAPPACSPPFKLSRGFCTVPASCPDGYMVKTSMLGGATCVAKAASTAASTAAKPVIKLPDFMLDGAGQEIRVGSIVDCNKYTNIEVAKFNSQTTFVGKLETGKLISAKGRGCKVQTAKIVSGDLEPEAADGSGFILPKKLPKPSILVSGDLESEAADGSGFIITKKQPTLAIPRTFLGSGPLESFASFFR